AIEWSLVSGNTGELPGQIRSDVVDGASAGGVNVGDGGGTITNTLILDNHVTASNVGGDMFAFGGGLVAFGPLTLQGSKVNGNSVDATSSGGAALDDAGGL